MVVGLGNGLSDSVWVAVNILDFNLCCRGEKILYLVCHVGGILVIVAIVSVVAVTTVEVSKSLLPSPSGRPTMLEGSKNFNLKR